MKKYRKLIQLAFLFIFFFIIAKGNMFIWLGLFLISLIGSVIFGRFYCGYICPMNTVMGATGNLSKKLNWSTKSVPKVLQSKYLPWIVLVLMFGTMVLSKKVFHQEVPILIVLMIVSVLVTLRYPPLKSISQLVTNVKRAPWCVLKMRFITLGGKNENYTRN